MSSPNAKCPRCGHHSRFEGRHGSVVRCSCGADLVLSEVGRPPLGTRWGDLSAEERAALPVGTVLSLPWRGQSWACVKMEKWWGIEANWTRWLPEEIPEGASIAAYPADPRDSDGPVDEGGGDAKSGDNDHAWDDSKWRCVCGYSYGLGAIRCPRCCRYPVRDCDGAEDAPRDCLPDVP